MRKRPKVLLTGLLCLLASAVIQAGEGPTVTEAWARATPPGAAVGAAYMSILGGDVDDRLLSARTERAASVELHTVEESAGMMRMRPIEFLEVPAGKRTVLAPQGTHLMLMDLDAPLVAGDQFKISLSFEVAGEREVTVRVREATGEDAGAQHHHH